MVTEEVGVGVLDCAAAVVVVVVNTVVGVVDIVVVVVDILAFGFTNCAEEDEALLVVNVLGWNGMEWSIWSFCFC